MGPFSRAPTKNVTNGHYTRAKDAWEFYKLQKSAHKPSTYKKQRTVAEAKRIIGDELYKISEMKALYVRISNNITSKQRKREAKAVLRWFMQYEADWKALSTRVMRTKTATFPPTFKLFPFKGGASATAFAFAVARYFNAVDRIHNPGTGNWQRINNKNINAYRRRKALGPSSGSIGNMSSRTTSVNSFRSALNGESNVPLRQRYGVKPNQGSNNEKNRRIKYLSNVLNMEVMFQQQAQRQLMEQKKELGTQEKELSKLKKQLMECKTILKKCM